jgi:hypothetical protein
MIIQIAKAINTQNVAEFAWAGLRRFQNVQFVQNHIIALHKLEKKDHKYAKKQAEQIRYCLIQAREYYDAANAVSLATKPNLLYYCVMSLVLAEILLKQTGDSSLDRARKEHRHHGLELRLRSVPGNLDDLTDISSSMTAIPLMHADGTGFGTFELWHRSCRELPLAGNKTDTLPSGTASSYSALLIPNDERLPRIPNEGVDLGNCFRSLPGMMDFLRSHGISSGVVRGKVTCQQNSTPPDFLSNFTVTIHPGERGAVDSFFENVYFSPDAVDRVNFVEISSGGIIKWTEGVTTGRGIRQLPNGSNINQDEFHCWPTPQPLNEFGYIYLSLFIMGNYARYYPDKWLKDVEQNSFLALAVEELIRNVESRMAILALSEMTRVYHVPAL